MSERAGRVFVREGEGEPLAWGNGLGFQGLPAPATYRGQQGWVWPSVQCLVAYVNFLQRFSVGNVESAGYAAKGGDCWYPVRPRGMILEVRTEARGGNLGNLLSCTALEPWFQPGCRS